MIRQCLCRADRSVPIQDIRRDPNRFDCPSREFFRVGNNIDHRLKMVHIYVRIPKRDMKSTNMLTLHRFHLHNLSCHHKVATSRCILVFDWGRRWDKEICCRDKQLLCNSLHHFRRHNRDIHRNGNWRVCREHWHSEIGHRDMAENLLKIKESLESPLTININKLTYCKQPRPNYHRNRFYDCILEPHRCIERRWHNEIDPIDKRCLCSLLRLFHFDNQSIHHISFLVAHMDQRLCHLC